MPGPSRTGPDARLVLIWQQCSGHDLRRQTNRQTDAGGKNPRAQGAPDKDGCPAVAGRTVRRQTQVGTRTLMSTMSQGLPCLMARTLQQIPAEPRKLTAPAWRISPSSRCQYAGTSTLASERPLALGGASHRPTPGQWCERSLC